MMDKVPKEDYVN